MRWAYVAATFFALSLYAYAAVVAPLAILFVLVAILRRDWLWTNLRDLIGPASLFLALAAPFLLVLLKNHVVHGPLPFEDWLPFSLPAFEKTRLAEIAGGGVGGALIDNARFLSSGLSDNLPWNHPPGIAPLPPAVLALAAFGAWTQLRRGKADVATLTVCSVCATAPLFPMNVNRVNVVFVPLAALAGLGAMRLFELIKDTTARRASAALLGVILLLSATDFYRVYFGGAYNQTIAAPFRADLPQALRLANAQPEQSGPILLDLPGGLIYVLAMFHDPSSIPAFIARTRSGEPFDKEFGDAFGRYYFSREKLQAAGVRKFIVIQTKREPACAGAVSVGEIGRMSLFACTLFDE